MTMDRSNNFVGVRDEYLGDGVYASFDGYHIILDLRGQDNTTRIALEPPVMAALVKYRDDAMKKVEKHQDTQQD